MDPRLNREKKLARDANSSAGVGLTDEGHALATYIYRDRISRRPTAQHWLVYLYRRPWPALGIVAVGDGESFIRHCACACGSRHP